MLINITKFSMLNICFNIGDIWNNVNEFIKYVQDILKDLFELFTSLVNLFPSPYKELLLGVSSIILIILIYNILRKW